MDENGGPARWQDKRGRAALADWRVWVFSSVVAIFAVGFANIREDHGLLPAIVYLVVVLAARALVSTLIKTRTGRRNR